MGSDCCKASCRKTTASSSSWKSLFYGCLGSIRARKEEVPASGVPRPRTPFDTDQGMSSVAPAVASSSHLRGFTFTELSAATEGFAAGNLIGTGIFGPVYRGSLEDGVRPGLPAQAVAVKRSRDLEYDIEILLNEAMFLAQLQLRHPSLVKMIGYCCHGRQRLLVYKFMGHGSVDKYLSKFIRSALPWSTRLNIALSTAKALASLHGEKKPLICGAFNASNILLDSNNNAKLLDLKLVRDVRDNNYCHHGFSRVGVPRCMAPEYYMGDPLTTKIDVFSFGVVMLEILITGLKSVDMTRPTEEQDLVVYTRPRLQNPMELAQIMDLALKGIYPVEAAHTAALVVYKCLHIEPKERPDMSAVVQALELLTSVDVAEDVCQGRANARS